MLEPTEKPRNNGDIKSQNPSSNTVNSCTVCINIRTTGLCIRSSVGPSNLTEQLMTRHLFSEQSRMLEQLFKDCCHINSCLLTVPWLCESAHKKTCDPSPPSPPLSPWVDITTTHGINLPVACLHVVVFILDICCYKQS